MTEAFLERAAFHLMSGSQGAFSPTAQWQSISNDERRMLLAAAIEKVVIVPRRCHRIIDEPHVLRVPKSAKSVPRVPWCPV